METGLNFELETISNKIKSGKRKLLLFGVLVLGRISNSALTGAG